MVLAARGSGGRLDKNADQGCDTWLIQGIETLGQNVVARAIGQTHRNKRMSAPPLGNAPKSDSCTASVKALHDALLTGQFATSLKICHTFMRAHKHDKTAVYLQLLLPTISELGRDWSEDRAGFDEIAFAYSLMHKIIETLGRSSAFEKDQRRALNLGRVIVAVAPTDTHEFGARILVEYLNLRGWDVIFVDSDNTPGIAATLQNEDIDALALSVSTDTALLDLADMIAEWRRMDRTQRVRIIVGGSAIIAPRDQYSFLQADQIGLNMNQVSEYLLKQATNDRHGRWNLA